MIECGLRAVAALDEQLHAGSTFYFPTNLNDFLAISRYFLPTIVISLSLIIQAAVLYYHLAHISQSFSRNLIEHIEIIAFGMELAFLPTLTEGFIKILNIQDFYGNFCSYGKDNILNSLSQDKNKANVILRHLAKILLIYRYLLYMDF